MSLMSNLYQRARDLFSYNNTVLVEGEKPVTPEFVQTLRELAFEAGSRMSVTDTPMPVDYRPKREGFLGLSQLK